ncbi:hypothetical protein [Embleya scabrispora]|uniref:hypothetical protein n=1 Tax=Embleya scabrispora TaxID=159449 RepID=UPI001374E322|nr:hypothetical protein [Embleya scabrispora]
MDVRTWGSSDFDVDEDNVGAGSRRFDTDHCTSGSTEWGLGDNGLPDPRDAPLSGGAAG